MISRPLCFAIIAIVAVICRISAAEEVNQANVTGTSKKVTPPLPFSATTTAAPAIDATDRVNADDEDSPDPNDSTLDDFEDTLPDAVDSSPSPSSLSSSVGDVAAGLSKALDLFETLTTVWQSVNGNQARAMSDTQTPPADQNSAETTAAAEARYIKGDPLKGYYDFIITEGSYKFWAVFQLATALLMIYSTFAAIYYSKVNPIVSDYDYVSYLGGRSLGAASSGRSANGGGGDADGGAHPLSSLLNAGWMHSAAHGFEWVLDAVDRVKNRLKTEKLTTFMVLWLGYSYEGLYIILNNVGAEPVE